jgi:hypothetical protein
MHDSSQRIGASVRYEIQKAGDTIVAGNALVNVFALDQFGNINTAENRDVTLRSEGSLVLGAGVVDISSGKGSRTLTSEVAQSVVIQLLDSSSTLLSMGSPSSVIFIPGKINLSIS